MMIICFPSERKFMDNLIYTRYNETDYNHYRVPESWVNGYIITYTCNSNSKDQAQKIIFSEKVFKQNIAYIVLIDTLVRIPVKSEFIVHIFLRLISGKSYIIVGVIPRHRVRIHQVFSSEKKWGTIPRGWVMFTPPVVSQG